MPKTQKKETSKPVKMAKPKKKEKPVSLESILWNCRNALRGTVGGNEKNRDEEVAGDAGKGV